jgi:prevent-host-death family protein
MSAEAAHYNMHDAKTHLARIIERMERSEEIIIDRAGTPVAKVVPLVWRANRTAVGSLAGQLDLSGDWDSPQTNAEIADDFGIGVPLSGQPVGDHPQTEYRETRRTP